MDAVINILINDSAREDIKVSIPFGTKKITYIALLTTGRMLNENQNDSKTFSTTTVERG